MSAPVRWGFLGAGWIAGRALATAVHTADGAVLQAVASRSSQRAAALAPVRVHTSYDALLADPDVDAVYVCLTNDAHLTWTLRALAAGKHVLCEKPLGLTADEVRQMTAAAAATGRLLVEASAYRWHPRIRAVEQLVASGALGEVEAVDAGFTFDGVGLMEAKGDYRLDSARGGGALYDVGCYAVSAALLACSWPDSVEVTDVRVRRHRGGVDEATSAQMRADSATVAVSASISARERQWVLVRGSEAQLRILDPVFTAWVDDAAGLLVDGQAARVFEPVDPYRAMVESVSAAVRGDEEVWLLPLSQSLAVAKVLDAIRVAG